MTNRLLTLGMLLASTAALAQPAPGLTLRQGTIQATVVLEIDASADRVGDPVSIAPDVSFGLTDDLTVSVVHSQFGRTGFRGTAGAGVCVTDACGSIYDNVGFEGLYSVRRGALAIAANAGLHVWSFDREQHVLKLGAKLRYRAGPVVVASLPAVTVALDQRDAMVPNRDRMWLPVTAHYTLGAGFALGIGTGLKGPLAELGDRYEIAGALLASYTLSPSINFGASWVHGTLFGGELALPGDTSGLDLRAINVWVTATR